MITNMQATISKDLANKKILTVKEFEAPVEKVWEAWTDKDILDKWWAPKPWKARTKSMDFRENGFWLYCMVGPDGTESWARVEYISIVTGKKFIAMDSFCDEIGNKNPDFPTMHWKNEFIQTDGGTRVEVEITFSSEDDFKKILEMGFEEGFTSALGNLDELL